MKENATPRTAEWEPLGSNYKEYFTHYCSKCGEHGLPTMMFCPHCGAKMKDNA